MADGHLGFPLVLRRVCDLLGCHIPPRYVVFKSSTPFPGGDFRADVYLSPYPSGPKQPQVIHGRNMPTLYQTIQKAAWEALARLRHSEPVVSQSRAFRFFPARPQPGAELIQTSTDKEVNPAIISSVAYGAAMSALCDSLLEELVTTRRTLIQVSLQLKESRNPASGTSLQAIPAEAVTPVHQFIEARGAVARVQQQPQEQGVVLEGVPVDPPPAEDGEVDTTLRLGRTPPSTQGPQAE